MRREAIIARLVAGDELARGRRRSSVGTRPIAPEAGASPDGHRPAAVLVPLIERSAGITVLLTRRTDHLPDHPGQVSFPGGRIEADDHDAVAAALREAEEEIGLPRVHVSVVGRLDDYETGTGFIVTPVVGLIAPPFPLEPDPHEVAEVFEVPLAYVLDKENHERRSGVFGGRVRSYYVLPYEGRFIWGATAGMLVNLYEVLTG